MNSKKAWHLELTLIMKSFLTSNGMLYKTLIMILFKHRVFASFLITSRYLFKKCMIQNDNHNVCKQHFLINTKDFAHNRLSLKHLNLLLLNNLQWNICFPFYLSKHWQSVCETEGVKIRLFCSKIQIFAFFLEPSRDF